MPEMPSSVAAAVTAPTAVAAPRTSCTGSGTNGSRPVGGGLPDGGGRTGVGGSAPSLSGGVPLGVVNPKAWLAIAAVCASGRLAQGPVADAVAKAALLTVVVAAIHVGWLLA